MLNIAIAEMLLVIFICTLTQIMLLIIYNLFRYYKKFFDVKIKFYWSINGFLKTSMKILEHVAGFVTGKITLAKEIYNLFLLETKLASLNIIPLITIIIILLILISTSWLTLMIILCYLISYYSSIIASLIIVLMTNILLIVICCKILANCWRKMTFIKTRNFLGMA